MTACFIIQTDPILGFLIVSYCVGEYQTGRLILSLDLQQ